MNSVDVANLYRHALLQGDPNVWELKLKRLAVKNNIYTRYLSDRQIKEYATIDEDGIFKGNVTVRGNLVVDQQLFVDGTVNGVTISPSTLLLRSGNQSLNCKYKCMSTYRLIP